MQQRRYFAVIPFISTMATAMQTGVEAYYVPRNTFVPQTTAKSLDLDSLPEIKGARARRVPAGAKFACKPLIAVGFLVVAAAAVAIAVPFLLGKAAMEIATMNLIVYTSILVARCFLKINIFDGSFATIADIVTRHRTLNLVTYLLINEY
ncbi:unnamed protein product [Rotaria socialis]|uniref:Uncharacterized protein n=1 Tax=Rotaria socialis TaxID=392032 RepID=A0A821GIR5_9BILA|nr:unnamed protein product [Rotaria socialis]